MTNETSHAASVDDRRSQRSEISRPGVLTTGVARSVDVTVVNVSAHGAMILVAGRLVPGRPVTLGMQGLTPTRGRVAWMRDGHCGIAFDQPLALAVLLALV